MYQFLYGINADHNVDYNVHNNADYNVDLKLILLWLSFKTITIIMLILNQHYNPHYDLY